ncbi:MAG: acetyl-CoA carboxylase biotin carboxyl carrier protein [Candidatus Aminicenantes bacterium]|nr:acetyl-CoA carboxylase biotin carboxyl carrier protein [Candidatus Aminicenantes bacterium]MDH5714700.1 acetyl-CoA carboxylase biotin carboxyl carrier protein [Candidatus Aminicenantes bacterium]
MNLQEIKELLKLITESNIQEFELERAGIKIRIKKADSLNIQPTSLTNKVEAELPPETKPAEIPPPVEEKTDNLYIVKSPIVGTFYRSPSPDSPPYIEEGEEVSTGKVLCIIEAMKVMNEIASEVDGRIVKIFVKNEQPVEYGEKLFAIKTS